MAQVEFTQQFIVPFTAGTAFYVQLQTAAGKYVVKGLQCYSSAGLASIGAESLAIISSSNGSGTGAQYIYSTNATIAANTITSVCSPTEQVVLTQPYLGFLTVGTSGTMTIQISYSFIPSTAVVSANFGNAYTSVVDSTGATFTGLSATVPTLLKSIVISNPTNVGIVTVTPLLTTATSTASAFNAPIVLNPGQSQILKFPLYLTNTQTISIQSVSTAGSATVRVLYCYTEDLNA